MTDSLKGGAVSLNAPRATPKSNSGAGVKVDRYGQEEKHSGQRTEAFLNHVACGRSGDHRRIFPGRGMPWMRVSSSRVRISGIAAARAESRTWNRACLNRTESTSIPSTERSVRQPTPRSSSASSSRQALLVLSAPFSNTRFQRSAVKARAAAAGSVINYRARAKRP